MLNREPSSVRAARIRNQNAVVAKTFWNRFTMFVPPNQPSSSSSGITTPTIANAAHPESVASHASRLEG
jgi:hypothetical protein